MAGYDDPRYHSEPKGMLGAKTAKELEENCGNCALLTWDKRDEEWDMSGEFKTIDPIKTRCSDSLMKGRIPLDPARSECLFWKAIRPARISGQSERTVLREYQT